jgi:cytochrome c oxidase subunit II
MNMKIPFAIFMVAALALLVACNQTTTDTTGTTGQVTGSAENVVEIDLTASNWAFDQSTINVKKGDRVRITVRSDEGAHGLGVEGYGATARIEEGQTQTLEFIADKEGTFVFFCNVPCGEGHKQMRGQLIVAA